MTINRPSFLLNIHAHCHTFLPTPPRHSNKYIYYYYMYIDKPSYILHLHTHWQTFFSTPHTRPLRDLPTYSTYLSIEIPYYLPHLRHTVKGRYVDGCLSTTVRVWMDQYQHTYIGGSIPLCVFVWESNTVRG